MCSRLHELSYGAQKKRCYYSLSASFNVKKEPSATWLSWFEQGAGNAKVQVQSLWGPFTWEVDSTILGGPFQPRITCDSHCSGAERLLKHLTLKIFFLCLQRPYLTNFGLLLILLCILTKNRSEQPSCKTWHDPRTPFSGFIYCTQPRFRKFAFVGLLNVLQGITPLLDLNLEYPSFSIPTQIKFPAMCSKQSFSALIEDDGEQCTLVGQN